MKKSKSCCLEAIMKKERISIGVKQLTSETFKDDMKKLEKGLNFLAQ